MFDADSEKRVPPELPRSSVMLQKFLPSVTGFHRANRHQLRRSRARSDVRLHQPAKPVRNGIVGIERAKWRVGKGRERSVKKLFMVCSTRPAQTTRGRSHGTSRCRTLAFAGARMDVLVELLARGRGTAVIVAAAIEGPCRLPRDRPRRG
jgi:hypothetical protein